MLCVPTDREAVEKLAVPLLPRPEDPRLDVPSRKFTVPVGVCLNAADVTVAVNVTLCPTVDGFTEEVSWVVVVPRLAFRSTPTVPFRKPQLLLAQFAVATSGLLSPFRSATAMPKGVLPPEANVTAV